MIAKEPFATAVRALLDRQKHRDEVYRPLQKLGIDITSDPMEDAMVDLLDASLCLTNPPAGGLVSWWLYDCSFMVKDKGHAIMPLGDTEHIVGNPEELYDLAVAYNNYQSQQ